MVFSTIPTTFKDHKTKINPSKSITYLEKNTKQYNETIGEFASFISILRENDIIDITINTAVIIPTITKWLDYTPDELTRARNALVFSNESNSNIQFRYVNRGMSQSHIVKTVNDNIELDASDFVYYYPYKTIGDLSQIMECKHSSGTHDVSTISMFITFDRVCGYLSAIFNRTMLESLRSPKSHLYNLSTFIYSKNDFALESFRNTYKNILNDSTELFSTNKRRNNENQKLLIEYGRKMDILKAEHEIREAKIRDGGNVNFDNNVDDNFKFDMDIDY